MNFHTKSEQRDGPTAAPLAYQPAPRNVSVSISARKQLRALIGAPIFGSRLTFPARFNRIATELMNGRLTAGVQPEHAAWYFGRALEIEVDPARLVRRLSDYVLENGEAKWVGEVFLDAADWSAAISPIAYSPIHGEMSELVDAGADYRDTRAYQNLLLAIELGKPGRRNGVTLSGVQEIEAYMSYCLDLIKSARKRGIVRRRVSGAFHRLRVKHRDARSPAFDSSERDIGVAITADGEIIRHLGGKHRTAIAQALKLPWMPVQIRLVHVGWIAKQMERTGLPAHKALRRGIAALRASGAARA